MVVQAIARRHGLSAVAATFQGVAAEGTIGGERVLAAAARHLHERVRTRRSPRPLHFYKLPLADIVVFPRRDRAAARQGARRRSAAAIAGHNGLRSITAHIGNDYQRVRIGVGHPDVKELVQSACARRFRQERAAWVEALCDIIADNAELLVEGKDATLPEQGASRDDRQGLR